MAESWGNGNANKFNEDLVSDTNNKNIIKINDVDDDKKALHVINSSTDSDARALKAEGMSEIVANSDGNPASTGLKVVNVSSNANAKAIEAVGDQETDGNILIKTGSHGSLVVPDVNDNDDQSYAAQLSNSSTHSLARALYAHGTVEVNAESTDDPATIGLKIVNESANANAKTLVVEGAEDEDVTAVEITGQTVMNFEGPGDDRSNTLSIIGKTLHAGNFGALKVEGTTNLIGVVDDNLPSTALVINNENENGLSKAIHVKDAPSYFNRRVHIENDAGAGEIDSGEPGINDPQNLKIGTNSDYTNDLILSREGQTTHVQGDLQVDENALLAANVSIGPSDADGELDSGGDAVTPKKFKIGSNSGTDNLELGRSGKLVDMKTDTRFNGNELIVDSSGSIASGCGFVYNATGSGTSGQSIDVYIGGSKVGYWNATGWH